MLTIKKEPPHFSEGKSWEERQNNSTVSTLRSSTGQPHVGRSRQMENVDRSRLRYPSDLTDDEWAHVELLIPPAILLRRLAATASS